MGKFSQISRMVASSSETQVVSITFFYSSCCRRSYEKLSYCWETVRRESMPRIAEMDMEMTT